MNDLNSFPHCEVTETAIKILRERDKIGTTKYNGRTVDHTGLNAHEWARHHIEELADGIKYALRAEEGLKMLVSARALLSRLNTTDAKRWVELYDQRFPSIQYRKEVILFLDIDGVLNSHGNPGLHTDKVELLRAVLAKTSPLIVLSSNQRKTPECLERIKKVFPIYDVTPVIEVTDEVSLVQKSRPLEIIAWLEAHPEFTEFVILDDIGEMGSIKTHLVKTDARVGLTPAVAEMLTWELELAKTKVAP